MACAMAAISTVFASTPLVGPALATSLEASRGGVDMQPLVDALKPAALVREPRALPSRLLLDRALHVRI